MFKINLKQKRYNDYNDNNGDDDINDDDDNDDDDYDGDNDDDDDNNNNNNKPQQINHKLQQMAKAYQPRNCLKEGTQIFILLSVQQKV
jgi:hypothetical protein